MADFWKHTGSPPLCIFPQRPASKENHKFPHQEYSKYRANPPLPEKIFIISLYNNELPPPLPPATKAGPPALYEKTDKKNS
jgi:hypothetical protein